MKKRTIKFSLLIAITIGLFITACSNDEWDKHYNNTDVVLSNQSLSEIINNETDLTIFHRLMEISGYDKLLSSSQTFTVWAPLDTDSAWRANFQAFTLQSAVITTADSLKIAKVVGNHISRFSYTTSGLDSQRLYLLCNKITDFKLINNKAYFGKIPLGIDINIPAKNGVLHKINGYSPYVPSHWEYLMTAPKGSGLSSGLDSITDYFNSLIIEDDYGKIVNTFFRDYAKLDDDDSTYTFIALNNHAWAMAIQKALPYHRIYNDTKGMQRIYSQKAIISDLFFSRVADPAGLDSIISVNKTVFHDVNNLFVGATKVKSSNGPMFIVDSLRMKAQDSWHKKIVVEAERNTYGRNNISSDLFTRSYNGSTFKVSNGSYVFLKSTGSAGATKAMLSLNIPNVLSAKYNLYVVFVPEAIENATTPLPVKAEVRVYYRAANGRVPSTTPNLKLTGIAVPKDVMLKKLIGTITFPWCSMYLKGNPSSLDVKVEIENIVSISEESHKTYKRDLRVDCVILEPVE